MRRLLLQARAALLVIGAVCSSRAGIAAAAPGPDFPFTDLKLASHTLAEFRGKVVLLEFWASWCIPCRKGFPFLDELQARHETDGFKVVAVSLEPDNDAVFDFALNHPGRFLVGQDPSGRAGELYAVSAMPTAILLDRDGSILARFEGGTETVHKEIAAVVDAALHGGALPDLPKVKAGKGPSGNLRAWERGYLADPIMSLDGDHLTRSMSEHVFSSKEAAAGNGGVAGGGCGCN